MRVVVVHSFYRSDQPSGENAIVLEQVAGLREAGHEVLLVARNSDEEARQAGYRVRSAVQVATGTGPDPLDEIAAFRPDVVHVHNLFPNFGRSWVKRLSVPMVATLHNFRSVCANGLLFRDGHTCFDCPRGSSLSALRHRCYRDSRVATVPLAIQSAKGIARDPVVAAAAAVICLSDSAGALFAGFGAPADRLVVVPNGIKDPGLTAAAQGNSRWLFAGRLSAEKGALDLVRAWPADMELDVVGDGPQMTEHRAIAGGSVRYLGALDRSQLLKVMRGYDGLVFPSECLEMQPTVVLEAMSMGLPVVAKRGNAGADLVQAHGSGITYGSVEELASALEQVRSDRGDIGRRGRVAFEAVFTLTGSIARLEEVYRRVVARSPA